MKDGDSAEVIVVTGARGGLGVVTCARLAARGFRVVACDLPGAATANAVGSSRDDIDHLDVDVTEPEQCERVAGHVTDRYGRVDRLVHLAGVRSAGLFLQTPLDSLRAMFDVNYLGVTRMTRALLPMMREARRGRIVVVSSVGALAGIPGLSGYCASKAAVEGWAESVAMETGRFGITWSLIEPASFRSGIWGSGRFVVDDEAPDAELGHHLAQLDEAAQSRAFDPDAVATRIVQCCTMPVAPFRCPVGTSAWVRHGARGVVPSKVMDRATSRALKITTRERDDQPGTGRRVLVTGASSGLGRSLVVPLGERGWEVIAAVRSEERAAELRPTLPDGCSIVVFDQREPTQIAAALDGLGPLDALVANAGMKVTAPFEELPDEAMVSMLATNTLGTLGVVRETAMRMAPGRGRIVVVGSSSGFTGMPTWSGYAASKFALERWADAVRPELAHRGLTLTLVEPGAFDSEIWRAGSSRALTMADYRAMSAKIEARDRSATSTRTSAAEVADAVVATLDDRNPPARVPVGVGARLRLATQGIVPSSVVVKLLGH